jgi:hypothetical protein
MFKLLIAKLEILYMNGQRELEKQAHRKTVEAGETGRTLGDYVANAKMRQVGDACAKTHRISPVD